MNGWPSNTGVWSQTQPFFNLLCFGWCWSFFVGLSWGSSIHAFPRISRLKSCKVFFFFPLLWEFYSFVHFFGLQICPVMFVGIMWESRVCQTYLHWIIRRGQKDCWSCKMFVDYHHGNASVWGSLAGMSIVEWIFGTGRVKAEKINNIPTHRLDCECNAFLIVFVYVSFFARLPESSADQKIMCAGLGLPAKWQMPDASKEMTVREVLMRSQQ